MRPTNRRNTTATSAAASPRFASGRKHCRRQGVPALIRAPLVHYYYEIIHPFWDGNGRVGRVLEASILLRAIDAAGNNFFFQTAGNRG
ncbi:MAG: Fic family protein, partial [Cardiobacterium sp.]